MNKLYKVRIEFEDEVPVAAETDVDAERIAKEHLGDILGVSRVDDYDFAFYAEELKSLPKGWEHTDPYIDDEDDDFRDCKKVLEDYLEEKAEIERKEKYKKMMDEKQLKLNFGE
jgi:hypothetical protein